RRLVERSKSASKSTQLPKIAHNGLTKEEKYARKKVYEALVKSDETYKSGYSFNTLIAATMEALNALSNQKNSDVWTEGYWILLNILEPIIPHISWELSEELFASKNMKSLKLIDEVFEEDSMVLAVTINGKRRTEIEVPKEMSKEDILLFAKERAQKWLDGTTTVKEIYVPGKLVNLVVR
ncbi:MAG: leucine--tRNA ligase, partial [Campylobacteraceae bacterium]|nr:leucine--tRNA ligase [Campylobacteraceae bacterium]